MDNNVRYRQKIYEDFEESLFRLAVYDASGHEGAYDETEKSDPERENPSELQLARFEKAVRRYKTDAARRERRKRIIHRCAASVAALLVIFAVTLVTVDAFRLEVLNFLIRMESQYTFIRLEEPEPAAGWTGSMPAYVPEGYEVQSAGSNELFERIVYMLPSDANKIIVYTVYEDSNNMNIDTEAACIGEVVINGRPATLTTKDGMTSIVWSAGNRIYYIDGTISTDEIVRMAESIEI